MHNSYAIDLHAQEVPDSTPSTTELCSALVLISLSVVWHSLCVPLIEMEREKGKKKEKEEERRLLWPGKLCSELKHHTHKHKV